MSEESRAGGKARLFENPDNGHREAISADTQLWATLFGFLYFLYKGVWTHAAISAFVTYVLYSFLWLFSIPVIILFWTIYGRHAADLIANHYLKKGWREVTGEAAEG